MAKTGATTTTNRDGALNAAVEIVGTQGIHALTHGRVDTTAGLPKGSTSNYFRNRAALIRATVDHLVTAEQSILTNDPESRTIDDLVNALVEFVHDAAGPQRTLTTARFAFFIEASHNDQVREGLVPARRRVETWAARTLETLAIPAPFAAARRILAQLEGLILHNLTFGDDSTNRADIAAVVQSCLRGPQAP